MSALSKLRHRPAKATIVSNSLPGFRGCAPVDPRDVTEREFVATVNGELWPNRYGLIREWTLSQQHSYLGYAIHDDTTRTEDGRYRARAILVSVGNGRARSQRFLDFQTFAMEDDARKRAIAAARAWIDEEEGNKHTLTLPTDFSPSF